MVAAFAGDVDYAQLVKLYGPAPEQEHRYSSPRCNGARKRKVSEIHKTMKVTPAIEAGLTDTLHDIDFIIDLIDVREPKSKKHGPYKKRIST